MDLTEKQQRWLEGEYGTALQWAMEFNYSLGCFFDADRMVPIASAHFAPDTRMGGDAGQRLLRSMVESGARVAVPAYLDPCGVDIERASEIVSRYGLPESFVASDRETQNLCRVLGFLPTYTCINYQSITPPLFREHLAWGDTGAAISANALFGARTNFEGGPSALASALIGCTPAYGMHLSVNRRANVILRLECSPAEIADWGAVAAWAGGIATGYDTVPVFHGDFPRPSFNMLKQLGVALASYGGHAMFHVVGVTPEAVTLEAACGDHLKCDEHVMTETDLKRIYAGFNLPDSAVDIVVFAAPQLSIDEVNDIASQLVGRHVHENTKLILAVDPQVKSQADRSGLTALLQTAGAEFFTGTCFYPEAPLLRQATGWRNVVTNSAKLVNTLSSSGYNTALRRLSVCIDAATSGRLEA